MLVIAAYYLRGFINPLAVSFSFIQTRFPPSLPPFLFISQSASERGLFQQFFYQSERPTFDALTYSNPYYFDFDFLPLAGFVNRCLAAMWKEVDISKLFSMINFFARILS